MTHLELSYKTTTKGQSKHPEKTDGWILNLGFKIFHTFLGRGQGFLCWGDRRSPSTTGGMGGVPPPLANKLLIPPPPPKKKVSFSHTK